VNPFRRQMLLASAGLGLTPKRPASAQTVFALVKPDYKLVFPRDHGGHSDYRTEWWYVTGWLQSDGNWMGFQITFFRSRTAHPRANPSELSPTQLLVAHVALADPQVGRLMHDQLAFRVGGDVAQYSALDTRLRLKQWRFERQTGAVESYVCEAQTPEFGLSLSFLPGTSAWQQGIGGFSQKGPLESQASHYYSRPQMKVKGQLRYKTSKAVQGLAWLDHEWSSTLLDPQAVGWDWVGINFFDGRSLMAFRIRDKNNKPIYAYANADALSPLDTPLTVTWLATRTWKSPRTQAVYPIAWQLKTNRPALDDLDIRPLMPDQELDARASTTMVYWEGAIEVWQKGQLVGRGYLELTGYHGQVRV
jgi:predicted secreted hydrolase